MISADEFWKSLQTTFLSKSEILYIEQRLNIMICL